MVAFGCAHVDVNVTQCIDGEWQTFRAVFGSFDAQKNTIVLQEVAEKQSPNAALKSDVEIGVAFRRGHKKCLFTTKITGQEGDTLLLQEPTTVRAVQRRAYQRVNIPSHRFIPVKVWEGSLPNSGEVSFPVCSGRVANISMSTIRVDPPKELAGQPVERIADLSTGEVRDAKTGSTVDQFRLPAADVVMLTGNGCKLIARPSGTEPKIKFYVLVRSDEKDIARAKADAQARIESITATVVEFVERVTWAE